MKLLQYGKYYAEKLDFLTATSRTICYFDDSKTAEAHIAIHISLFSECFNSLNTVLKNNIAMRSCVKGKKRER